MRIINILHDLHGIDLPDITEDWRGWYNLSDEIKHTLSLVAYSQCQVFHYLVKQIAQNPRTILLVENSYGWEWIGDKLIEGPGTLDNIVHLKSYRGLSDIIPRTLTCDQPINLQQIAYLAYYGATMIAALTHLTSYIHSNYKPPYTYKNVALDTAQHSPFSAEFHKTNLLREYLTLLRALELCPAN